MEVRTLTPKVLFDLGLLHDCRINSLSIDEKRLSLVLEDVHANTVGLPEYPGMQAGTISIELRASSASLLEALQRIDLPARIYELEFEGEAEVFADEMQTIILRLWPDGCVKIPVLRGELVLN
jgi:hypothetical protein